VVFTHTVMWYIVLLSLEITIPKDTLIDTKIWFSADFKIMVINQHSSYVIFIVAKHRHLSNIDCLMTRTVCFIRTVNGYSKNIKDKKPIKTCASSRHKTNLKQSILESFNIYVAK
jgi:hypothetical protein